MTSYLITYDLLFGNSSQSAVNLTRKIQAFRLWAHPLTNVWLIKTELDRNSIYNFLKPHLYPSDKILIINVTDDWISYNLGTDVVKWMQGGL